MGKPPDRRGVTVAINTRLETNLHQHKGLRLLSAHWAEEATAAHEGGEATAAHEAEEAAAAHEAGEEVRLRRTVSAVA